MAAGQRLQADVAEGLDQQSRGRLGVHGGVAEIHRAAEAQLVADDDVARIGDRMTDDRDFLAAGSGIGGHGEGHTTSSAAEARA